MIKTYINTNQNNSTLKAAVVILALLLLGSIGYIFKMSSDNNKQVTELTTEKDQLANDLKARIAFPKAQLCASSLILKALGAFSPKGSTLSQ